MLLHGRKLLELQKWYSLRFVVNPLRNSFAFSSSADLSSQDCRKGKNFTVSYLIDSLGLTSKLAESISRKVRIEDKGNAGSVLSLLRSHGFTDSQISNIIRGYPMLLRLDADKSLGPKLKFLQSRGASSSEFTKTLSKVPKILSLKGEKTLTVYYDFVKEIVEVSKSSEYEKLCHSLPQGGKQENVFRNVSALREFGVPQRLLFSLLISNNSLCCVKEKLETSLKKVVEFGFDPTKSSFIRALRIIQGLREETIEEKVNVYRKFGLADEDIWVMFKKCPECLTVSEKKITHKFKTFLGLGFSRDEFVMLLKHFPGCLTYSVESLKKKIEFVVKKMNWPLKSVITNPAVLGYSLEKRTIPRCEVIKALMSKGLIGDELPPLGSVCACNDQAFLDRFVRKHDDKELVAELTDIFTGKKSKRDKASER